MNQTEFQYWMWKVREAVSVADLKAVIEALLCAVAEDPGA